MTEVEAKRYAGPFEHIPFEYFIQSPIGLVPKDKGRKTRLIFHLSYPRWGDSVNSGINPTKCKVHYPDFSEAVKICIKAGKNCHISKSDMSMAFRNVPLNSSSWPLLVLKAYHPVTKKVYFFVDKCLPFGSSISCMIFQLFSNSVAHLVKYETKQDLVNYLDDYFFTALLKAACDGQVEIFLKICHEIRFPVSLEKTCRGLQYMTFLGYLLDTINQLICVPIEKIDKALDMIEFFFNKRSKTVTKLQVQKLCGFLNFLSRAILPGRTFVRHLYVLAPDKLQQHHHVRVKVENRMDLLIWKKFYKIRAFFVDLS